MGLDLVAEKGRREAEEAAVDAELDLSGADEDYRGLRGGDFGEWFAGVGVAFSETVGIVRITGVVYRAHDEGVFVKKGKREIMVIDCFGSESLAACSEKYVT